VIRCFTGLPGHGKTLKAVAELIALRQADQSRPLYVRGIKGLTVDHATIEGPDWEKCPDGSLIVIDEAQQVFPTRRSGDTPAFVQALATHRHRGIDIWLITQHPSLLDSFVRRLVDRHTHIFRLSGAEVAQVYEWGELQDDPRSMASREVSEAHTWTYPKTAYSAYASAVLHTSKFRLPKKLVYLAVAAVVAVVCVWGVVSWGRYRMSGGTAVNAQAIATGDAKAGAQLAVRTPSAPQTADEWLALYQPRVPYRPESAPAYDRLLQTASPPKLLCIDVELRGCSCYTDQATRWKGVDELLCKELARDGILQIKSRSY